MNITVIGMGFVGLSNAVLLSQKHNVTAVDIMQKKVDLINRKLPTVKDEYIENFLKTKKLNLHATLDMKSAVKAADYILICTPTDFSPEINSFDVSGIERIAEDVISVNRGAITVIKSTVPIGFTQRLGASLKTKRIMFSPEFLREGNALYDNLYPSRIIVGSEESMRTEAGILADIISSCAEKRNVPKLLTETNEAEAIKLFSNAYLAMRVSFFNELDTFSEAKGLNSKLIIEGVCHDKRIGTEYNNPSFGYGGYCLPKDTKQLLSDFGDIPESIIGATVESNIKRKDYIAGKITSLAKRITEKKPIVGIYRLVMKSGSDNFRQSAILDIINIIKKKGIKTVIFEPCIKSDSFLGSPVISSLESFKRSCDIIIANRFAPELCDVKHKVYTRDLFSEN